MQTTRRQVRALGALSIAALVLTAGTAAASPTGPAAANDVVDRELTFVDTSRPTHAVEGHNDASPSRSLSVLVVYPRRHHGPLPLVVFNHGVNSVAASYRRLLERIASWGYVVAGLDSPESSGGIGLGGVKFFTEHPADMSFVVDRLVATHSGLPAGLVDGKRIAVAGHSLGGVGVYGIGFNSCCRDARIRAVVTFEGALLDYPGGRYTWHGPPLLMVLGDRDPLVPYTIGTTILAEAQNRAYLLSISGGGHGGGLKAGEPGHPQVDTALHRFLDAYVKYSRSARRALAATKATPTTRLQRSR